MENKIHKNNNKKALKKKKFRDLQHVLKPIECKNKTLAQHFRIPIVKMKILFLSFSNAMTLIPLLKHFQS